MRDSEGRRIPRPSTYFSSLAFPFQRSKPPTPRRCGRYAGRCRWPLAANLLDPVRATIVCRGPARILQAAGWFAAEGPASGLTVRRVKNKFAAGPAAAAAADGYRDLSLSVVYEAPWLPGGSDPEVLGGGVGAGGLRIVGEIQIHDSAIHELKNKVRLSVCVAPAGRSAWLCLSCRALCVGACWSTPLQL